MAAGISLSNKSQLLFGFAVLTILAAALSVPWVRTQMLVRAGQFEAARQTADAWLTDRIQLGTIERPGGRLRPLEEVFGDRDSSPPLRMVLTYVREIDPTDDRAPFIAAALAAFQQDAQRVEYTDTTRVGSQTVYRYARVLRESQMRAIRDRSVTKFTA